MKRADENMSMCFLILQFIGQVEENKSIVKG